MKKIIDDIQATVKKYTNIFFNFAPIAFIKKNLDRIFSFLFLSIAIPIFLGFWSLYTSRNSDKRFQKEFKPLFSFKSRKARVWLEVFALIFAILNSNYLVRFIQTLIGLLSEMVAEVMVREKLVFPWWTFLTAFDLRNLFSFTVIVTSPILFIPIVAVFFYIYHQFVGKLYKKHRSFNANEQGDDRLITEKELQKTYKKIPNRGKRYKGYGGTPVAHELKGGYNLSSMALRAKMQCHFPRLDVENKNDTNADEFVDENASLFIKGLAHFGKRLSRCERVLDFLNNPSGYYYIEADAVNTLLVGMTRSGKGETYINPMIDILSRAEKQSSMVVADPKGELFQMSSDILKKRGYNVQVLNYQNIDFSMSNNPLQLALEFAQKGYFEQVQSEVTIVAESLYRQAKENAGGNAKFWEDSSMNLFSAIIMAIIWRAKETSEWDTVTIRHIVSMLNRLGSEEVFVDNEGTVYDGQLEDGSLSKKSKLTVYFDELHQINKKKPSPFLTMADDSFRQSNFAGEEAKGNIFSSMIQGVSLFLNDSISRMTSKNNLDITTIGFPRQLSIKMRANANQAEDNPHANQVALLSILDKNGNAIIDEKKVIVDIAGYLNLAIEPKLPNRFTIKVKMLKTGENLDIAVAKKYDKIKDITVTSHSPNLLVEASDVTIKYSEKPTAVFLVMPPHKKAFAGMVSLFVDQVFMANYDMALQNGRATVTRVHFLLDEFGNMPMIRNMAEKLSIGLGQGLLFSLAVQNLEQIEAIYGKEDAATIAGNCSINEYIKSVSSDTMKKFEESSGEKTVTTRSKTISDKHDVSINEQGSKQAVLTKNQLQKLQSGEAYISIGVKGEMKTGQKTTNLPILVKGKFEFPYRYMFLSKEFDQSKTLADIPIKSKHRHLKLVDIEVDWSDNFEQLQKYHAQLDAGNVPSATILTRKKAA